MGAGDVDSRDGDLGKTSQSPVQIVSRELVRADLRTDRSIGIFILHTRCEGRMRPTQCDNRS